MAARAFTTSIEMQIGLYGSGQDRYGLGYCPSFQKLMESEVKERFDVLKKPPGNGVRLWLWSFYGWGGTSSSEIDPGWAAYWPHLGEWLHGDGGMETATGGVPS